MHASALSSLVVSHPWFWEAPILQQPMGCVLDLETCKTHVWSFCSAYKLCPEKSCCFILVFPLVWPESLYNDLFSQSTWIYPSHGLPLILMGALKPALASTGGHNRAAIIPASSELTQVFQTPGYPEHTTPTVLALLPPPKPKASKLISLAVYNRNGDTIMCVGLISLSSSSLLKTAAQSFSSET